MYAVDMLYTLSCGQQRTVVPNVWNVNRGDKFTGMNNRLKREAATSAAGSADTSANASTSSTDAATAAEAAAPAAVAANGSATA
jgi:hypothetical protein